ncbi:MAG: hypothetical protein ACM3IJ_00150 [Candidatus Levyibacteriota bacterium]
MTNNPLLVLAATPKNPKSKIENFFAEEGNIFKLIKDPPYFRYSGWNLLTLDYPKIKGGKSWEVKNGDRKTIRIFEDGTLVAVCSADNSFLGWGREFEEFMETPNLNTLAVIEYVYEFVRLYKELSKHLEDAIITFQIELKNTTLANGKKLSLIPHRVKDPLYMFKEDAYKLDGDFEESIEINIKEEDERYAAFKIISRIFINFGIPQDKIPYTSKDDVGRQYVDEKTYME